MPWNILKCGTSSFRNAALVVAILDVIVASLILVMFILGSSLIASFKLSGNMEKATRVLDEITDDVFGTQNVIYLTRPRKDVIEDIGVFFIITFLVIADFVVSCIFVDGVKKWSAIKCQVWFDIRIITIVVFLIVVVINLVNGSAWYRTAPDLFILLFRAIGACVGYLFLQELHSVGSLCKYCRKNVNQDPQRPSVIDLSDKRMEVRRELREMPIVIITGPTDESGAFASESDVSVPSYIMKKKCLENSKKNLLPEFKLGKNNTSGSSAQVYS